MAEHYFVLKNYDIAQKMCDHGLKCMERFRRKESNVRENPNFRKELEYLRSDFNLILGKI